MVKKAIDAGFTSVMIDGSSLPFEENVAKTKEIVAYAHERNVTVEAEIGHVGEGNSYHVEGNTMLTTPEEAKKFVELTDVDSLAVSIRTAHGEYKEHHILILRDYRKSQQRFLYHWYFMEDLVQEMRTYPKQWNLESVK